ncbi:MAG: nitrous oxide reductase accessory protein NosL [Nitrospirae bacterium]|nr:nitrous oxide reductase accessory protein NosL [Nitrospirota bacterium]
MIFSLVFLMVSFTFAEEVKPIKPSAKDKCMVCGMFVAKYNNWIAEIIFRDGTYAFFDGPKDMFTYYNNLVKYNPSKKTSDIAAVYVTEYYSTKILPAEKLFFVKGSNVNGPMGEELVPIETEERAKEFMKDHNGKKILRFNEITMNVLK